MANSVIGKRRKSTNKPWITEEMLRLMDNCKSHKAKKSCTEENRGAYCQASAAVERQGRRDKQRWLEEQCQIVEEGLKTDETRFPGGEETPEKLHPKTATFKMKKEDC